jgi:hypothetical protein
MSYVSPAGQPVNFLFSWLGRPSAIQEADAKRMKEYRAAVKAQVLASDARHREAATLLHAEHALNYAEAVLRVADARLSAAEAAVQAGAAR